MNLYAPMGATLSPDQFALYFGALAPVASQLLTGKTDPSQVSTEDLKKIRDGLQAAMPKLGTTEKVVAKILLDRVEAELKKRGEASSPWMTFAIVGAIGVALWWGLKKK